MQIASFAVAFPAFVDLALPLMVFCIRSWFLRFVFLTLLERLPIPTVSHESAMPSPPNWWASPSELGWVSLQSDAWASIESSGKKSPQIGHSILSCRWFLLGRFAVEVEVGEDKKEFGSTRTFGGWKSSSSLSWKSSSSSWKSSSINRLLFVFLKLFFEHVLGLVRRLPSLSLSIASLFPSFDKFDFGPCLRTGSSDDREIASGSSSAASSFSSSFSSSSSSLKTV